jgi:hypothetical protein
MQAHEAGYQKALTTFVKQSQTYLTQKIEILLAEDVNLDHLV